MRYGWAMNARRWAVGLGVLLTSAACRRPAPPPADLIIAHARRLEAPDRELSLAARDGRIVALGDPAQVARYRGPATRIFDAAGATVLPGWVDAHLHLRHLGRALRELDLAGCDLAETLRRLEQALASSPPDTLLRGRGWDQNLWSEADCPAEVPTCLDSAGFPRRSLLASVAPKRRVLLERVDGHALWVSPALLDAAELSGETEDPAGGQILRGTERVPSGVLVDRAMDLVEAQVPDDAEEEIRADLLAAQSHLLALGLTGAHDMGMSPETLEVIRALDAEAKLELRLDIYLWGNDAEDLEALLDGVKRPEGRRFRVVGVKLMADGALGSRGAALLEPYADAEHRGTLVLDAAELRERMRIAHERGYQIAVHAIGDRANRVTLDAFEAVLGDALRDARPRLEHAQILDSKDLGRVGALGVVASMQPIHAVSDLPWAGARLGPDRLEGAYAWETLRTSGATLAFGSDAPVEPPDVRRGLKAAVFREVAGAPHSPEQRLELGAALRAYSWGAAWASRREAELGALERGKLADLTLVTGPNDLSSRTGRDEVELSATVIGAAVVWTSSTARKRRGSPVQLPAR